MPLTETQARNAKANDRAYKLFDSEGLFLLVQPNGTKLWLMKYRFAGKEKLLSFCAYPAVGISAAKEKCFAAKAQLAQGSDPTKAKGEGEGDAEKTFEALAKRWHENRKTALNPAHAERVADLQTGRQDRARADRGADRYRGARKKTVRGE